MDQWVTIAYFTFSHEASILKGKLESEGIDCFLKDDLTIQTLNFHSTAMGNVRLQVAYNQYDDAIEILKEGGYEIPNELEPLKIFKVSDKVAHLFPPLRKIRSEINFIIVLAAFLILSTIITALIIAYKPISYQKVLTEKYVYISYIDYQNELFIPSTENTAKFYVDYGQGMRFNSDAEISFRKNGTIIFPGFDSPVIWGQYKIKKDSLFVTEINDFEHIYSGSFKLKSKKGSIIMSNDNVTIVANAESRRHFYY